MKAILRFKSNEKIVIDFLDTPIVKLWKQAHLANAQRGNTINGTLNCVGQVNITLEEQFSNNLESLNADIHLINEGIKLANESIVGDKFPYIAFYQMPWMQVNRIHRCYTTASVRKGIWFHNLNALELLKCKTQQYISRDTFFKEVPSTYTVIDDLKFFNGIELINKHIHMYERFIHSQRTIDFHNYYQSVLENSQPINNNFNYSNDPLNVGSVYTDFNWDNFDEYGGKIGVFTHRTNYDDIKKSIPEDWDKYDVFLNKCIAGKDYEHSYFNYDDPLEADITNVDGIDGGMRVHYDKNLTSFYNYPPFKLWYQEKGVEDSMVRPIPLGKINRAESTPELYKIQINSNTIKSTSGYSTLEYPFDHPIRLEFV
jgi:hypothetical protein